MEKVQCYGWNCVPPKRYVEILTPSPSESYHIWRYNLHRGNQVEMRSLGWALIQCDSVLLKRGNLVTETDTQGEDSHVTGRMHLQAKEYQGLPTNTRSWKRQGKILH